MSVEFSTLSLQSGETKTCPFSSRVINAKVALQGFSGSRASVGCSEIRGNEVAVTASRETEGTVEVLVIALVD